MSRRRSTAAASGAVKLGLRSVVQQLHGRDSGECQPFNPSADSPSRKQPVLRFHFKAEPSKPSGLQRLRQPFLWKNTRFLVQLPRVLVEKIVYSSSPYPAQPGFEKGQMVFFEGVKRFELEDLLRASAEMLGKGGFGTVYKAVLDDGNIVAVKRLKHAQVGGRREFEQHMEERVPLLLREGNKI